MILRKIIWQLLAAWLVLHLLFVFNERYTVAVSSKLVFNNLNENQYNLLFFNKSIGETTYYLRHTSIKYLGIFPEWTAYLIYSGYFIILGYGCYLSINEDKTDIIWPANSGF